MDRSAHGLWLDEMLANHERLMPSVKSIIENLIKANGIEYLAVSGRVKNKQGALDKIQRKGYKDPVTQLTDISGIRVIVYFESDVERVSNLIKNSFNVNEAKSLNKDKLLSVNKIGYRSVHFVCDLGGARSSLPEFKGLQGLPFEFQVRTVLQHAWAELAHDRNYKMSGRLPEEMERTLNLYAGLLEVADKGFDELSSQIDSYVIEVEREVEAGELDLELNTISLLRFVADWCERNGMVLRTLSRSDQGYLDLIQELNLFGVRTIADLDSIVPSGYAEVVTRKKYTTTIYGLIRDWMLITDWRKYIKDVPFSWVMSKDRELYAEFMGGDELDEFVGSFEWDEQGFFDEH